MRKDKSLVLYPKNYVVVDIETTGFSAVNDEIIELSALKVEEDELVGDFSTLVNPMRYVSPFILNLTGIELNDLYKAPKIQNCLQEFMDFVGDSIIVGHNINFDLNFIHTKLQKHYNRSLQNDYIDTLKLARKFLPQMKSHKLGLLAEHFSLDTGGMHRGLKDCSVTNECYQRFVEMAGQKHVQNPLIIH